MNRWNLSIRAVTRVGQKLSGHLKSLQDDCTSVINLRFKPGGTLSNIPPTFFLNMDQTAIFFESKTNRVVAKKGEKCVPIRA